MCWLMVGLAHFIKAVILLYRLRSSLWLQFKPHHIAAGAAYLAAKFLNFDLAFYQNIWREFETTPAILQDVSQQLMELFQ
ncbi:hypothetical protein OIU77_011776 [Salix suchowensis]|uniref:Uncharacterized protein n=1 Tax=Salix suchowensis TaxID=1278906 RepID=A0ABQ9A3E9_9ROSI|nr:hypothetical protein OIU77_011776 [Salix suchowensis]